MRLSSNLDQLQVGRSLTLIALAWVGAIMVGGVHSLLPINLSYGYVGPDLLLLTVIFAGFEVRQPLAGTVALGVLLGYLDDLLGGSPKGMHMLVFAAIIMVARGASDWLLVRGVASTILVVLGFSLCANLLICLVQFSLNQNQSWQLLVLVSVTASVTALVSPLWFWLLRRVDRRNARESWLNIARASERWR